MKNYEVTYHECYSRTYDVEANSKREAELIIFNEIMDGKRATPDECYNTFYITEEVGEVTKGIKQYENEVKEFINAIKEIAGKQQNLDNLELYLSVHFADWLNKFVDTPEDMASELKQFANMECE